ncbi:endonuclease/exonuclease/phosphatase family protein [Kitasatospora sp. NBC_00240]|uniref:endonuclease/exonuclease/phosphatase family protein n=1 Tax=Kitasatospora sp. NBC_00240 TaxID=2903567 RepID=UPI002B1D9192|nr:endonuclease/exonuclease/phosphatase family protein [Kitasatospora sp. NBC_00240]
MAQRVLQQVDGELAQLDGVAGGGGGSAVGGEGDAEVGGLVPDGGDGVPGGVGEVDEVELGRVVVEVGELEEGFADLDAALVGVSWRVLLLGDLNTAAGDHALGPLTSRLSSAQDTAGGGFGFTWPAAFPSARIDHIMSRNLPATAAWTLPATTSDHRPAAARLSP